MAIPTVQGARRPADVPKPLWQAITAAGKRQNVPPDLLAGIWRIESGSTFPNPAVNSSGYGGLFGTKLWDGTTQQQANYSAAILHNALLRTGGRIGPALSIYNSGQPTGGYTSVPGETTFGTVAGYGSPTASPVSIPTVVSGRPRPGGGGVLGGIESVAGAIAGGAESAAGSVVGGFESVFSSITSVLDFLKAILWLVDPRNWLRAVEVLFGFVLILTGVVVAVGGESEAASVASALPIE